MAGDDAIRRLLQEAASFERTGAFSEAARAYRSLLARHPGLPDTWYELGRLERRLGNFEAALGAYEAALRFGVSKPEEVHLNRGVIYSDYLRRDDLAESELKAALALNSAYVPALLNLANLNEDRGRREEARALYEAALAQDRNCWLALARLAALTPVRGSGDPMVARLREAISRPDVGLLDKADLGFSLGKILDESGFYDEAFAAYTQANRASAASAGRALYDPVQQDRLIDAIIEAFPSVRRLPSGGDGKPPVFICGMFRSGSTLVEQILASHPRVTAGGELELLPRLVREMLSPFPSSVRGASEKALLELRDRYLGELESRFPAADVVTDKRPDNFLFVGLIKTLFPDAKIVHTVRNPLDNCLSVFFLHLDHAMGYALDLTSMGHYYVQYRRLMSHWKALFPSDILDLGYDALVAEPRQTIEALLAFCGLDWDDRCLEFHLSEQSVKTASVWQVRKPLYRSSSGRAKHYEKHLGQLTAYLRAQGVLDG